MEIQTSPGFPFEIQMIFADYVTRYYSYPLYNANKRFLIPNEIAIYVKKNIRATTSFLIKKFEPSTLNFEFRKKKLTDPPKNRVARPARAKGLLHGRVHYNWTPYVRARASAGYLLVPHSLSCV